MKIAHTQLFSTHFDTEAALFTFVNRFRQWKEKYRKTMAYFGQIAEQFFYYRNIIA